MGDRRQRRVAARRSLWLIVALLLTALVRSGPTVTAATRYLDATFAVDVQRDLVYGAAVTIDGVPVTLTLDLYTPRGDTAASRPAFVFAHGGFFFFGSKNDGDAASWANRLAQRGYVAASINYRLSSTPVFAPASTARERSEINAAREDMQTAVRWLRAHAADLRVDSARIAVGGVSAGAVTALGVALNRSDPGVGDNPDLSSAVCTAVSVSGANDPLAADDGDAGAIFHHGADDVVVPVELARETRDAMVATGLPVQWHEYPGEGHTLSATAQALIFSRSVQWLYDRVATAATPCSAASALAPRVAPRQQTELRGAPSRSGVVSLIAVDTGGPGYLQVLPCGAAPGASSNFNADGQGQIRAALAVVDFAGDGGACLYNEPRTHLVADVQGYFAQGAFDDIADVRILDTRGRPQLPAGHQTVIRGRPDTTAIVSLVITQTSGPGFVQLLPCGAAPGAASNSNADRTGQTRATLAFVRFDAAGEACVYNETPMHLVVDLQGYLAPDAFVDVADVRLLDTRGVPPPAAASMTVVHGAPDATAVVSVVAADSAGPGFVQLLDCAAAPGAASNLNTDAVGQTVAGLAFVRFDHAGTACVFTERPAHLLVDLQGYLRAGAFDDVVDTRVLDTRRAN